MQEGGNKPDKKRVVITSLTTLFLLVFPYTAIPDKIFFIVPLVVEGLATLGIMIWTWQQVTSNKKMKSTASENLRRSIDDDIDKTKLAIERAPSKPIAKLLEKHLVELYQEKREESVVHRKGIREDIKRYDHNQQLLQAERESIQASIVQKVGEEFEKASDTASDICFFKSRNITILGLSYLYSQCSRVASA
jgi:hypothetical protein